MIADKRGQTYQHVVSTRLRFAMLRSTCWAPRASLVASPGSTCKQVEPGGTRQRSTLIAIRGFKGRVKNKELSVDEDDFSIIPSTMCVAI